MENTTKAILIGVGLFITIALISAVLVIMGVGNNLISGSSDNLNGIVDSLERSLIEKFDDKTVTGSDVRACLNEYRGSTKLTITLDNIASNSVSVKAYATASKSATSGQVGYKKITTAASKGSNGRIEISATAMAGYKQLTDSERIQNSWLSDSASGVYVKASSTYHSSLIVSNGEVVGVAFTKAN